MASADERLDGVSKDWGWDPAVSPRAAGQKLNNLSCSYRIQCVRPLSGQLGPLFAQKERSLRLQRLRFPSLALLFLKTNDSAALAFETVLFCTCLAGFPIYSLRQR
jgi:hypothetical protein